MDSRTPPTDAPPSREGGEMRLIQRAAAILRALTDQPSGASLGQLASATGLARSTVQRVVNALAAERLVLADSEPGTVRLGLEIARLASYVQSDARVLLRPHAERLLREVEETVDVTVLDGDHAVVIEQLVSPQSLRVVSQVGRSLPLHATASGKAHLAGLSAAERRRVLSRPLVATSPRTKLRAADLIAEIETSARSGLFVDDEEFVEGVSAMAVRAPLARGGDLAIAISMPASRFTAKFEDYAQAMRAARAALAENPR